TSRRIRPSPSRCATRSSSRTYAATPPASRCCRWWTSSAATEPREEPAALARAASARGEPGADARRDRFRTLAAHVHADVPGVDGAGAVVAAAEAALHGCGRRRRHDVVGERVQVQHRLADRLEVDRAATDAERAVQQAVLLVEPAHEL